VATGKLTHPIPFPAQSPQIITSSHIAKYAEVAAILAELEKTQRELRSELLALHAAGAEQEADSPYLLSFVHQARTSVDWKLQALVLAEKLYGVTEAATWKSRVEQSAPPQAIVQIRVKPNPAFAAGICYVPIKQN
jgi:hypothetical protein